MDPGVTHGRHPLTLLIWEMGATAPMMKVRLWRLIQGSDLVLCKALRGPWWPWTRLCSPSSLGFPFEGPASSDLDFPGGQRLWRARSLGEEAVAFLPASASIGNKDEAQCPSRPAGWCPCLSLFPGPGRGGQFLSVHTLGPTWWNPPSPDAGQSSRRLTTTPPQGSPLLWSLVLAHLSSQPPPHGSGSPRPGLMT